MTYFKIKGVIPPMITPFKDNGDVDYNGHIDNVKKWNEYDLAGYLVLGSNSETIFLTEEEKLELIKVTKENMSKDKILVAGTGLESIEETIKLTNKAADLGADTALLLTPSYYAGKMNDEALINYFTEVANASNIPIMIYNVTKFTHVNISPYAVGVLSNHPNIIGMKDSAGSITQLVEFKSVIDPEEFNLIVGTASCWFPAMTLGIDASIMALVNCSPKECIDMQKYFDNGEYDKSRELYERMYHINKAVTGTYGISGLKYTCSLLGFNGGKVRKPLLELKDSEKIGLEKILKEADII